MSADLDATRAAAPGSSSLLRHLWRSALRPVRGLLPEERRYWILVPVTGLVSGLCAVALESLLELIQRYAWGGHDSILEAVSKRAEELPWRPLIVPVIGGVIVMALVILIRRRQGELQGTPALMEALAFRKGRLPFLKTLVDSLAAVVAVGTGASLGREGAMIHAGAAIGSGLGARFKLEDHHVRILLACGAAAGIAAAYNVPIGASIFAMEVLLGSFAMDLFGPIIICSLISTAVARTVLGDAPLYVIPPHVQVSQWEILLDILLGVSLGLLSVVFIRIFSGVGRLFRWLEPLSHVKPVLAMLVLGALVMFLPDLSHLLGNGYDTVNLVLAGERQLPLFLLLGLPALKILATALCRGAGVPGGLFTPSLFVGALVGAIFGQGVNAVFPAGSVAGPAAYALVGMGAILAGTIHAPVTAILMIFEMTEDYGIILPLMAACISSALVSYLFQQGSLYTEPLRRRGIRLPGASAPSWLRQPTVRGFLNPVVATVLPSVRFRQVVDELLLAPEGQTDLYVTSLEGQYLGTISLHDIKRFVRELEHLDSVIAADIVDPGAPCIHADEPLSKALEILAATDSERLPVLDGPASRRLLGTVSKRKLLTAYAESNLAQEARALPPAVAGDGRPAAPGARTPK